MPEDNVVGYTVKMDKEFDTEIRYWQNRRKLTARDVLEQACRLWIFLMEQEEKGNTIITVSADQAEHYKALIDFDQRLKSRSSDSDQPAA